MKDQAYYKSGITPPERPPESPLHIPDDHYFTGRL
jgi:hypothetical protein